MGARLGAWSRACSVQPSFACSSSSPLALRADSVPHEIVIFYRHILTSCT